MFETSKKRLTDISPFDVVIVGGGLAGLTLAIQIKRIAPKTEILVLERQTYPVPEAAFKVGESTLEGAAYYFSRIVGMREHLENEHLHKHGFRFLSSYADNLDITQRPELGVSSSGLDMLSLPSYQIDRGRFENTLVEEGIQLGITFLDSCKVTDFIIDDPLHTVTFQHHKTTITTQTRWVVDASGVAGFLKNRFGLSKPVTHDINAAWLRVNDVIDINNWSSNPDWQDRVEDPNYRKLCTNHLCGAGYWVWIIPLGSEVTSIGIVADPTVHSLKQFNRLDRALSWLEQYEPELMGHINNYVL